MVEDALGWDGRKKLVTWRLDFPCPSYLLCVAVRANGQCLNEHLANALYDEEYMRPVHAR